MTLELVARRAEHLMAILVLLERNTVARHGSRQIIPAAILVAENP